MWVTGGEEEEVQSPTKETAGQFGLSRTFQDLDRCWIGCTNCLMCPCSVGSLTVTVVEASGLGSSKLQGRWGWPSKYSGMKKRII